MKFNHATLTLLLLALCAAHAAARQPPEPKLTHQPSTEAQKLVGQMETVLAALAEQGEKKKQTAFVPAYYVPYFVELKKQGHVEAFVYHALRSSGLPGVREWSESNSGRVMRFLLWSKKYQWPAEVKN